MSSHLTGQDCRGTLTYVTPDFATSTLVGTFLGRVNDHNRFVVIARRKGGRNSWLLCSAADVVSFVEGAGWAS